MSCQTHPHHAIWNLCKAYGSNGIDFAELRSTLKDEFGLLTRGASSTRTIKTARLRIYLNGFPTHFRTFRSPDTVVAIGTPPPTYQPPPPPSEYVDKEELFDRQAFPQSQRDRYQQPDQSYDVSDHHPQPEPQPRQQAGWQQQLAEMNSNSNRSASPPLLHTSQSLTPHADVIEWLTSTKKQHELLPWFESLCRQMVQPLPALMDLLNNAGERGIELNLLRSELQAELGLTNTVKTWTLSKYLQQWPEHIKIYDNYIFALHDPPPPPPPPISRGATPPFEQPMHRSGDAQRAAADYQIKALGQ